MPRSRAKTVTGEPKAAALWDRRKMLLFMGGAVAGVAVSPLPWKLLDDISIWTQNPPWSVPLPRGRVNELHTHCPLCPAGCGVRVRDVAAIPFFMGPVPSHPLSLGHLCPLGLCGHHLLVHGDRLVGARSRDLSNGKARDIPCELGVTMLARAIAETVQAGKTVALLDSRPDTVDSLMYRGAIARLSAGAYVPLRGEYAPLLALSPPGTGDRARPWADLDECRNLLCFGAPITDGWGSASVPSKVAGGGGLSRVTLVVPADARKVGAAGRTIRVTPGSEPVLALGLARAVLARHGQETSDEILALLGDFDARTVASRCGIDPARISDLVETICQNRTLVLAPGNRPDAAMLSAMMALNVALGNLVEDSPVRFSPRGLTDEAADDSTRIAGCTDFSDLEDGSVDLVIVDDRFSRHLPDGTRLLQKLREPGRSTVVRLSAFRCDDDPTWDLLLPLPGPYERAEEILAPVDHPGRCYGLSMPLASPLSRDHGRLDPVVRAVALADRHAGKQAQPAPDRRDLIRRRVGDIFEQSSGLVFDPRQGDGEALVTPDRFSSAGELMSALTGGGLWMEDIALTDDRPTYDLLATEGGLHPDLGRLVSAVRSPRAPSPSDFDSRPRHLTSVPALPPIMGKLFAETDLQEGGGK